MAHLPPKPESPVKDDQRLPRDGIAARPMASTSTPFRSDRDDRDRPRPRPPPPTSETDTYIASYSSRRPPLRDWERDRPRDRADFDRRRDWRDPHRRDTRPFDRRRDDDRFRPRRYDSAYRSRSPRRTSRSRSPFRRRSRSPPPRRYSRSRSPKRSRTRSPRRRPYSPARNRPRPSSRSRSPPTKRLKLGNHSISDSPRSPRPRSRSRARSRSRTRSRSPRRPYNYNNKSPPPTTKEKNIPPTSPTLTSRLLSPKRTDAAAPPSHPITTTTTTTPAPDKEPLPTTPNVTEITTATTESSHHRAQPSTAPSPKDHPMSSAPAHPNPITPETREEPVRMDLPRDEPPHPKTEPIGRPVPSTPKPDIMRVDSRGRSPSPPKGPRASLWQRTSKSPPKGPRNHGGSSTPAMGAVPVHAPVPIPASGPMYPTGPRADRRPVMKDPKEELPVLRSFEFVKITPPSGVRWAKGVEQPGPKGRYDISPLELDLARYRSHRIHLNQDHDQISRNTRRALHELDMATIDLRMAETRKRIADAQLEKAKHGMLGIDGAPPPESAPDS